MSISYYLGEIFTGLAVREVWQVPGFLIHNANDEIQELIQGKEARTLPLKPPLIYPATTVGKITKFITEYPYFAIGLKYSAATCAAFAFKKIDDSEVQFTDCIKHPLSAGSTTSLVNFLMSGWSLGKNVYKLAQQAKNIYRNNLLVMTPKNIESRNKINATFERCKIKLHKDFSELAFTIKEQMKLPESKEAFDKIWPQLFGMGIFLPNPETNSFVVAPLQDLQQKIIHLILHHQITNPKIHQDLIKIAPCLHHAELASFLESIFIQVRNLNNLTIVQQQLQPAPQGIYKELVKSRLSILFTGVYWTGMSLMNYLCHPVYDLSDDNSSVGKIFSQKIDKSKDTLFTMGLRKTAGGIEWLTPYLFNLATVGNLISHNLEPARRIYHTVQGTLRIGSIHGTTKWERIKEQAVPIGALLHTLALSTALHFTSRGWFSVVSKPAWALLLAGSIAKILGAAHYNVEEEMAVNETEKRKYKELKKEFNAYVMGDMSALGSHWFLGIFKHQFMTTATNMKHVANMLNYGYTPYMELLSNFKPK